MRRSTGGGWWLAALVALALAWPRVALAQDAGAAAPPDATPAVTGTLRVGVAGSPPFNLERDGAPDGIGVEVWRAMAERAGLHYEFVSLPSVPAGINELAAGHLDVLAGPVSITAERAARVRFTQPYYHSSLAILARVESNSAWHRIAPFLSRAFATGVVVLLLVLTLVGTLMWLVERKRNESHFPRQPLHGIGNGIWFALVTMTTVGYGDRSPVTLPGRIISGIWMVIALISASSLTAGIASALTVSQIDHGTVETADQLARRTVATVAGTPGERFARRHEARVMVVPDLATAVDRVRTGAADAVVFDRPQLQYYLQQNPAPGLALAQGRYMPQGYGFAMPTNSTLQHVLNVHLLGLQENGQVARIVGEWLGTSSEE